MARRYSVVGNATNTASATLPMLVLTGAATVRPAVSYITVGSDATPAENAGKYIVQRTTAAGTGVGTPTPQPLDPNDPASLCSAQTAYTATGPTLTAGAVLHQWAQNQRATYQWWANPGFELKIPATAANGLAILPTVVGGSAVNMVFTVGWDE